MKNKTVWGIILVVAAVAVVVWGSRKDDASTPSLISPSEEEERVELADSPKNATYIIDGESVTLKDGVSETEAAAGSSTKVVTRYFGNEVTHDLNDDGREDVAFIVTHSPGGSGTFYYVVAAFNTPEGYKGSSGFLLGDRIAPQTTEIDEGVGAEGRQRQNVIVVNYADRKPGEPMTASPSVGKSVWLKLDPVTMQFGEVAVDFEGEIR